MEPSKSIISITPDCFDFKKINYITKLNVNQENKKYEIHFGINNLNNNELILKVTLDNYYYYYSNFNLSELNNISTVFSKYKNIYEIISYLKTLNYSVSENNDNLLLIFTFFNLNDTYKIIELTLKKKLYDSNNIINYFNDKIKLLKEQKDENINDSNPLKKDKNNFYNEINSLKEENKNLRIINNSLKKENNNLCTIINLLKEKNKNLSNEINQLKEENKKMKIYYTYKSIDSKIIKSFKNIEFMLDYIRENDNSFNFNDTNLLYRGSKDGDRTETCHKLCDNKKNIIIIIKSYNGYTFGGYSKVGFKTNKNKEQIIDNNSFLFSIDKKEIYPVIKNAKVICCVDNNKGLCFYASLGFYDHFLNNKNSFVCDEECNKNFINLPPNIGINGGKKNFKCLELEVFQLV